MRKPTRLVLLFASTLITVIVPWQLLRACAAVPRAGSYVSIAAETALIIWDAETKTQHFIRRATFDSSADDFGFLVPSPAKPDLAVAHDYTFKMLEEITAPEVKWRLKIVVPRPRDMDGAMANKAAMAPGGVHVLEKKRVGDYDAVVLKADDPKALSVWLQKHGYTSDKHLADWLTPYVEQQWILTAFKISNQAKGRNRFGSTAVRMSFQTDKPFFPYREPANQREKKNVRSPRRMLRIFCLASTQMQGTLGNADKNWPSRIVWSDDAPQDKTEFLLFTLGLSEQLKGKTWWLTEFEDSSSPRPGTDEVYFSPSPNVNRVARPPIIRYLTYTDDGYYDIPRETFWLVVSTIVIVALTIIALLVWRLLQKAG